MLWHNITCPQGQTSLFTKARNYAITARQDSGVSNHRGEHSAVLIEDAPRAILTPDRETVRQQGRRMKEPNEAMFTITAQDKHGIYGAAFANVSCLRPATPG